MGQQNGLRLRVVKELRRRSGELRDIAKAIGISYDTLQRIRDEEHDAGYSKIVVIARHLGLITAAETDPLPRKATA